MSTNSKSEAQTSGPEGNRSNKFASRLATPPHRLPAVPAGPITIQATKKEFPKNKFRKILFVDLRGIGPLTPPCHGGVLPVYHRPICKILSGASKAGIPQAKAWWTYRESNSGLRNANAPVCHLPTSPFLKYSSKGYFITKTEPKLDYCRNGRGFTVTPFCLTSK